MTTRRLLAISLALATPLILATPFIYAQDAPPPAPAPGAQSAAPTPPSRGGGADRDWGPRNGWDRGGRRSAGLLPFGMWWKNPEVATHIGLTAEQQKRIGDLFLQSRLQLIHLHASLQEEQLMLGPLLDATPFDEAKALAQIDKIADTRAELEKTNARMLLNIRGVLTADQWTKLRDHARGMQGARGDWGDSGLQGPQRPN